MLHIAYLAAPNHYVKPSPLAFGMSQQSKLSNISLFTDPRPRQENWMTAQFSLLLSSHEGDVTQLRIEGVCTRARWRDGVGGEGERWDAKGSRLLSRRRRVKMAPLRKEKKKRRLTSSSKEMRDREQERMRECRRELWGY